MMLFILRHGQAEPYRTDDASRALVNRGVNQVQSSAEWFKQNQFQLGACFASPYRRAQETAQVFLQQRAIVLKVQTESLLLPDSDPETTASWVNVLDQDNTLLASHMPMVALLTEQLCGVRLNFSTGSLAVLKCQTSKWQLVDFYTPEQ